MKLAVIAPPQGLPAVYRARLAYHMALGQHLRQEEYNAFYKKEHQRGAFIICDNGASEGDNTPFKMIVGLANSISADEICLPDVVGNKDETLKRTLDPANYDLVEERRRFVIPQGSTIDEWKACVREMCYNLEFATIGLVRYLSEYMPDGRLQMAAWLSEKAWAKQKNIHILGLRHNPLAEALTLGRYARQYNIRGLDTALPIAMAQHNEIITNETRKSVDWSKRVWLPIAQFNIELLQEVCNGYNPLTQ